MTSQQPVAVTKMSPIGAASSMVTTSYPSMAAWSALMGSISVTSTRAPKPSMLWAQPLPTSPKPAMTTTLPAIMMSVARLMPSARLSRQPYLLSNLDLVTESFTLIATVPSVPFFIISYRRWTPVVVSSETPFISLSILGYFSWMTNVKSPPSSSSKFGPTSVPGEPGLRRATPFPFENLSDCSTHHQYSFSVSPFQANTGIPPLDFSPRGDSLGVPRPTATAAAA